MQDGPERDKILDSYRILNAQFDESVRRVRADLKSGLPIEDLVVGGSAEFAKTLSVEGMAAALTCRLIKEASKPERAVRKKTAVVAKRAKSVIEVNDEQPSA